jgi:hypothetical protein
MPLPLALDDYNARSAATEILTKFRIDHDIQPSPANNAELGFGTKGGFGTSGGMT